MAKNKNAIRILLADDHPIFRDGVRRLLEQEDSVTIVGEASNGNECVSMLSKLKPDILLLDLRMPDKDGLAVLEEVNFDSIGTRVIVLTATEDDNDVVRAMRLQPYRTQKLAEQARSWTGDALVEALDGLLELDMRSKGITTDGAVRQMSDAIDALALAAWLESISPYEVHGRSRSG